jgi:hypothetical protein
LKGIYQLLGYADDDNILGKNIIKLFSIAERSEASTVFGRSDVEITGLNPAQGMDVCLRFSVLCCPVCQ